MQIAGRWDILLHLHTSSSILHSINHLFLLVSFMEVSVTTGIVGGFVARKSCLVYQARISSNLQSPV